MLIIGICLATALVLALAAYILLGSADDGEDE